ncbi:MAG: hypothetical protein K1X28_05530 [Parachlamydiales bacterium]|nr:hypothetical protein [Parachlamydiales bacterium]
MSSVTVQARQSSASSSAGELAISAEQAQRMAQGTLTPISDPRAYLEHMKDKTKRAWALRTQYHKTTQDVDLEKYKEFETKLLDDLWTQVKDHLGPGATKIRIDLGNLTIRYVDASGKTQWIDLSTEDKAKPFDPKLIELAHKVRKVSQRVWIDLRLGHNFNDPATRAKGALKPLQIPTDDWKKAMPTSIKQFEEDGHLDQLVAVSGRSRSQVQTDIQAAEDRIQRLKENAERERDRLKAQLSDPAFNTRPTAEQQEIRKAHGKLEIFLKELKEIDRLAIYFAAGVWGDADPNTVTPKERQEKAALISDGIESTLRRKLKAGEDDRWWITKKLGINDKKAEAILGVGPFIKTYAGDAGDMVLPAKLDYIRRLNEEGREERAPSLVEFITQAVTYRQSGGFDAAANFDALNLGFPDTTKTVLLQGF